MTTPADPVERLLATSRYMSFAGAGVNGMSYLGVMRALKASPSYESFMEKLLGCCGTSSGAYMALAVLVDVPLERLEDFFRERGGVAPFIDFSNLFTRKYGLDDGKTLREFIEVGLQVIGLAHATTFADLYRLTRRSLACCVTCINTRKPVYLSHTTHPNMRIADALYMSMCLPIIFVPGEVGEHLYVDGCLTENLPHRIFPIEETIHVYMKPGDALTVGNWKEYAYAVFCCSIALQQERVQELADAHPERFIGIDPCQAPNFALCVDEDRVSALVGSGYASVFVRRHPIVRATLAEVVAAIAHRETSGARAEECCPRASGESVVALEGAE